MLAVRHIPRLHSGRTQVVGVNAGQVCVIGLTPWPFIHISRGPIKYFCVFKVKFTCAIWILLQIIHYVQVLNISSNSNRLRSVAKLKFQIAKGSNLKQNKNVCFIPVSFIICRHCIVYL